MKSILLFIFVFVALCLLYKSVSNILETIKHCATMQAYFGKMVKNNEQKEEKDNENKNN